MFFYKASHESTSTRCVDQAQSCSRRQGEAGSAKTAWVGAKGLWPGTDKGSEAWQAREAGPGNTGSEQLGREASWVGQSATETGQAWTRPTGARTAWLGAKGPGPDPGPGPGARSGQGQGQGQVRAAGVKKRPEPPQQNGPRSPQPSGRGSGTQVRGQLGV